MVALEPVAALHGVAFILAKKLRARIRFAHSLRSRAHLPLFTARFRPLAGDGVAGAVLALLATLALGGSTFIFNRHIAHKLRARAAVLLATRRLFGGANGSCLRAGTGRFARDGNALAVEALEPVAAFHGVAFILAKKLRARVRHARSFRSRAHLPLFPARIWCVAGDGHALGVAALACAHLTRLAFGELARILGHALGVAALACAHLTRLAFGELARILVGDAFA